MAGIITVAVSVDPLAKRARFAHPMALGETVDLALSGLDGTTVGSLVLTLRDPSPPAAPRGETTPAAGHAVAACAVWSEVEDGLHGILDLRIPEMVRAFRDAPPSRWFDFALRDTEAGELLAAGRVAVVWNPDYAGASPAATPALSSGLAREFVTGGDLHHHDGESTARVSHYHLTDAGTLTHAQLEAAAAAAQAQAVAASNDAARSNATADAAKSTADTAKSTADAALAASVSSQASASAAQAAAAAAAGLSESLGNTVALADAANTAAHGAINGRLDALEAIRAPSVDSRLAEAEDAIAALQAQVAALLWRSTRIPDAEGTAWARIYAVEAAGRVALGPLGSLEEQP